MQLALPPGLPPAGIGNLARQQINAGFALNSPVFLTAPSGDTNRLFIVEQGGLIKVVNRATNTPIGTFLDLTGPVLAGGERGLLCELHGQTGWNFRRRALPGFEQSGRGDEHCRSHNSDRDAAFRES
jgi:hypothetical protein